MVAGLIVSLVLITLSGSGEVVLAGPHHLLAPIDQYRDLTILGVDLDDRTGYDVASGNVNNDGIDDLIIGAEHADPNGVTKSSTTCVLFGPLNGDVIDLMSDTDIIVNSHNSFDCVGAEVSTGDLNDDGVTDLLVGAWGADPREQSHQRRWGSGETYVLFGPHEYSVDVKDVRWGRR